MNGDEVIDRIRQAFADVPRGEISIRQAMVIDCWGEDEAEAAARALDVDQRWEQISDPLIEDCPEALSYFDPVSWRYHLPAYMIWTIRHGRDSDSNSADSAIWTLIPTASHPILEQNNLERFQALDHRQSAAVARFLQFVVEHDDEFNQEKAKRSLAGYWAKFLDE